MSITDSVTVQAPGAGAIRPQQGWSTARRIAAAALIVGPALQAVEEILEPRNSDDAERFARVADNLATFTASKIVGFLAVPILIGTLMVFAALSRGRAPRLAMTGASLGVLGMVGLAASGGVHEAGCGPRQIGSVQCVAGTTIAPASRDRASPASRMV